MSTDRESDFVLARLFTNRIRRKNFSSISVSNDEFDKLRNLKHLVSFFFHWLTFCGMNKSA